MSAQRLGLHQSRQVRLPQRSLGKGSELGLTLLNKLLPVAQPRTATPHIPSGEAATVNVQLRGPGLARRAILKSE